MILLKYLFIFWAGNTDGQQSFSRMFSRIHFIYTSIFMKGGCVTFWTGPSCIQFKIYIDSLYYHVQDCYKSKSTI